MGNHLSPSCENIKNYGDALRQTTDTGNKRIESATTGKFIENKKQISEEIFCHAEKQAQLGRNNMGYYNDFREISPTVKKIMKYETINYDICNSFGDIFDTLKDDANLRSFSVKNYPEGLYTKASCNIKMEW